MSSGINLWYRSNHSLSQGAVPSVATTGGTIPTACPREGMGRNIIMSRQTRLHHDGMTRRGARDVV
jgi:hypothetical protein